MRRKITKDQLTTYIKRLDTRCRKFDSDKIDEIINDAFSELNTIDSFFYDEDVLEITPYLEDGVTKLSYDVEKDVTFIYDAFLSADTKNPHSNSDLYVEVDPRVMGRVNIDFTSTENMYKAFTYHPQTSYSSETPTTLIVRFGYVPTSEFDEIFMNRDIYKALRHSLAAATYIDLHDEKKASIHSRKATSDAKAVVMTKPYDFKDEIFLKGFINGC